MKISANAPLQQSIDDAVDSFVHLGLGTIPSLLAAEHIDALLLETDRLWQQYAESGHKNLRVGTRRNAAGTLILERLDPVADVSPLFQALNENPRFRHVAEQALGEPVTVMKEKLTYKWPGTPGFGAHRDEDYNTPRSGVQGKDSLTLCLALDHCTNANSAIEFFPSLRTARLPAPQGEPRDIDEGALIEAPSTMPELNPGDVVVFDGQIPHRSRHNDSEHSRRTYMITYVPARYPDARRDFYAARLQERKVRRAASVTETLVFE